ncbi:hypothetical protein HQ590_15330 [bacterium]|nr:hypothetical protein [bacterium]
MKLIHWVCLAAVLLARPALAAPQRLSDRTVTVALDVDRDGVRLLSFTVKRRPFAEPAEQPAARAAAAGDVPQIEVALLGRGGQRYWRRLDLPGFCFEHGPDAFSHIEGDTIRVHRDSVVIDLPDLPGHDRIEVGRYEAAVAGLQRQSLGDQRLAAGYFVPAGQDVQFTELSWAEPVADPAQLGILATTGQVFWPEDFGDSEIYRVDGDAGEVDQRINIVIVPDGYTYAEKAQMEADAASVAAYCRTKTPFKEHDAFFNYTLVYAYSTESGTDQCDCDIIRDTAMGTRFAESNPTCGHSDNRCLYYGGGCDTSSSANLVTAELRAPRKDTTLVMVNTTRYGGCGGSRAVYSAGNSSAKEVAIHELGHSLAGLADEYAYDAGCGTYGGERNVSTNPTTGAWPEWIAQIGAPYEGARYYQSCLYRPKANCEMRSLNQLFCEVCNQRWALVIFGHSRVSPTAPIESQSPAGPIGVATNVPAPFAVASRLASGAGVVNTITWTTQGTGDPAPVVVASNVTELAYAFPVEGVQTVSCEVIASANFVKPTKTGANRDLVSWVVNLAGVQVAASGPVAAEETGTAGMVTFTRTGSTNLALTLPLDIGGTASNGVDYAALPGTLVLAAGNTATNLAIVPLADTWAEGAETVTVGVQSNGTFNVPDAPAVVTVLDLPMDQWRFEQFGAQANDPLIACDQCDPDHDGVNNLGEYLANTTPTDAASVLRVTAIQTAGQDILLRFLSASNEFYEVQRSVDPSLAGSTIVTNNVAGTGGVVAIIDPQAAAGPTNYFYRVRLMP